MAELADAAPTTTISISISNGQISRAISAKIRKFAVWMSTLSSHRRDERCCSTRPTKLAKDVFSTRTCSLLFRGGRRSCARFSFGNLGHKPRFLLHQMTLSTRSPVTCLRLRCCGLDCIASLRLSMMLRNTLVTKSQGSCHGDRATRNQPTSKCA